MDQLSLKNPAKTALAAMFILCAGAVVFYKARLFADTSYIAFNIINYKSLAVANQRYGSFITQLVPYLGQKLHLPLKWLLMGYVLSFNLFFFTVNALLVYRFKQYGLALLMGFYYLLFVSDSYFLANDEIHQAVAWMFLMFGVIIHLRNRQVNFAIILLPFLLLAVLTLFTHFIAIIPTFFILVYLSADKKWWPFSRNQSVLLGAALIAIIAVKFLFSGSSQGYEAEHLHNVTHVSLKDIIHSFVTPVVYMFFYRCLINYWAGAILFVCGVISLIKNKQKALMWWTVVSFIGYLVLMGLTYCDLDSTTGLFHIETEWQCISIIMAMPFVFNIIPQMKKQLALVLTVFIFAVRLAYISAALPAFTWRVDFNKKVLAEMKRKNIYKLALLMDNTVRPKYILDWTLNYESIFESAAEGDNPQRTFLMVNPDDKKIQASLISDKRGVALYNFSDVSALNKDYFNVDTTQVYQIMSIDDFFK